MIEVNRNNLIPGKIYYIHRIDRTNEKGGRFIGDFRENTMINHSLMSHFYDIIYCRNGRKIK